MRQALRTVPRPRVRLPAAFAATALAAAGLAGCGAGTEDYCSTLRADQPVLQRLASGKGSAGSDPVGGTLEIFHGLRDKSPPDLTDEWDTMVFAWQTLADTFERTGVDPATYRADRPPAGVSPAQASAIRQAALQLNTPRVLAAGRSIEQQARDVCKVDMSG